MKAKDVVIGQTYLARVSGVIRKVRVEREYTGLSGRLRYECRNLETNRIVKASAARLRSNGVPQIRPCECPTCGHRFAVTCRGKGCGCCSSSVCEHKSIVGGTIRLPQTKTRPPIVDNSSFRCEWCGGSGWPTKNAPCGECGGTGIKRRADFESDSGLQSTEGANYAKVSEWWNYDGTRSNWTGD